jgi:hypothetical protein
LKGDIPLIYLSMFVDQGMVASEKHLKVDIPLAVLRMFSVHHIVMPGDHLV